MTTTQKLERLKNRSTAYELVATDGDRSVLICYTARKSFAGILQATLDRGDLLSDATGAIDITWNKASKSIVTDNGWQIKLSGRTQRDAICNGELA